MASPGLVAIRHADWAGHAKMLRHVFLVGDLQRPVPHPFLRRRDVEMICCEYQAGDDGRPHWHETVDEFEFVIEGRIGYEEIATGVMWWFEAGDLIHVPKGVCVWCRVPGPARTLAIKLPSSDEKVICRNCARTCNRRQEPYQQP